jgi:hypothetical protein
MRARHSPTSNSGNEVDSDVLRLRPLEEEGKQCPRCCAGLKSEDFFITGLHNTVRLLCDDCQTRFQLELPIGHGAFYPGLVEEGSGDRVDDLPMRNWFLTGLSAAVRQRESEEVKIGIERLRNLSRKKLVILNTVDHCYGHSLYRLFNAQYFIDKRPDVDLVILVQEPLRWMVPDGAAQIWTVSIPFSRGGERFDSLDAQIKCEFATCAEIYLARTLVQQDSNDFDIARFTRIAPFPLENWDVLLAAPRVTFIWRGDRMWNRLVPRVIDNRVTRRAAPEAIRRLHSEVQRTWIVRLAEHLKAASPGIDFAVAGMADRGIRFPGWIKDFRHPIHTNESASAMCRRYAESHLVIGCNGSSLLLPGAHAGAVINLVPGEQWAVSAATFPFRVTSVGDTHFRYTLLPGSVSPKTVASISVSVLRERSLIELHTAAPWRDRNSLRSPRDFGDFRSKAFLMARHFNSTAGMISTSRDLT